MSWKLLLKALDPTIIPRARLNQIHGFDGNVLLVKLTKNQLHPRVFMLLDKLRKDKNL